MNNGESYCSISPQQIWEAVESAWSAELRDWDLEGSIAYAEAKRVALAAIAQAIEDNPG